LDLEGNTLFPVFLKLHELRTVLVGAGTVGLEKLSALLKNSPQATITIIAEEVSSEVTALACAYPNVTILQKTYERSDLNGTSIVIAATNRAEVNQQIRTDAASINALINVADKPDLCDFYLGSIVQKGNLKIAISTNGKSPTIAKRLKEIFNENLPAELDNTLTQMNHLRNSLQGDFQSKVKRLNEVTSILKEPILTTNDVPPVDALPVDAVPAMAATANTSFKWLIWLTIILSLALVGTLFWYKEPGFRAYVSAVDPSFYWFLVGGFIFAMIDGSIGMSYGVTSTAFSLSLGLTPASASMAVHLSEILSNGIAGWMHYFMGNINWKLFKLLIIPGILGAVAGAYLLSSLEHYSAYTKVAVSIYTLILGFVILMKSFKTARKRTGAKIKKIGLLGFSGGFIDALGGGGWGSIVLSSLIAGGRNARFSLGTVKLTRFFIAVMSSLTFVTMLNFVNWHAVMGLVLGSALASPIAARVSNKISVKTIMMAVGFIVILVSLRSIILMILKFI
jgi:siroheme synthase-like protein